MHYSEKALALVKEFEGFSATPYRCLAGRRTIGYGHTLSPSLKHITVSEAESLLRRDLYAMGEYLNQKISVPLTQGQYDALCSLIYNWGCANFGRSKGLALLNQNNYAAAAFEFFSKERGVVNVKSKFFAGLYKRRCAELNLWNQNA